MVSKLFRVVIIGVLVGMQIVPLFAQNQASTTPASQTPVGQPRGPLLEKENPLLIGMRNINKYQINFYSLEKETAAGRQAAAEIDRSMKLIDDPIVREYINLVRTNI